MAFVRQCIAEWRERLGLKQVPKQILNVIGIYCLVYMNTQDAQNQQYRYIPRGGYTDTLFREESESTEESENRNTAPYNRV